jgi:predicted alpha/beta hydrolase
MAVSQLAPEGDLERTVAPWVLADPTEVVTDDGTPIAAKLYVPARPKGAVFIVSAMGVPQSFYARFAQWLAAEGFASVTFDYRGMGESRRGSLRDVDADILTWAEQDTTAVLRELEHRVPGAPITWFGHSLGGQIIPFVKERERVTKIVTMATGNGYWRINAPPLRRKVWLFWWVAQPVLTPLFGYFPGAKLGMVGNLPRNVIRQWRAWCMQPDYAAGDGPTVRQLYEDVTTPITAFSFSDDEMMSDESITTLHQLYLNAPKTMHRLTPAELGVERVGHFGAFREPMRDVLWKQRILRELAQH